MRRQGIADNFARKQMRHQSIRQTDGYTDDSQLPVYDAIKNLPRLDAAPEYAQRRAQILGSEGQNVAQPVAAAPFQKVLQVVENGGVCRNLTGRGVSTKMERAKGFEPSTLTLAT